MYLPPPPRPLSVRNPMYLMTATKPTGCLANGLHTCHQKRASSPHTTTACGQKWRAYEPWLERRVFDRYSLSSACWRLSGLLSLGVSSNDPEARNNIADVHILSHVTRNSATETILTAWHDTRGWCRQTSWLRGPTAHSPRARTNHPSTHNYVHFRCRYNLKSALALLLCCCSFEVRVYKSRLLEKGTDANIQKRAYVDRISYVQADVRMRAISGRKRSSSVAGRLASANTCEGP